MALALVPLKDLVQAKSRLAGVLSPSERRALAQAMAEDVLSVLAAHPLIERVVLLSNDPGAGLLAQSFGAECWPESELDGSGLNALLASASRRLLAGSSDTLLVLHADLPLLTLEDVRVVLERQRALDGLLIACDRYGRGTNLLAFNARNAPARFRFGPDSASAHAADAARAGVPVEVVQRRGTGLDVDEPRDLQSVVQYLSDAAVGRTAQLLGRAGLGPRLALALATVVDETDAAVENHVTRGVAN